MSNVNLGFVGDFRNTVLEEGMPAKEVHALVREVSKFMTLDAAQKFYDQFYTSCPISFNSILCRDTPRESTRRCCGGCEVVRGSGSGRRCECPARI